MNRLRRFKTTREGLDVKAHGRLLVVNLISHSIWHRRCLPIHSLMSSCIVSFSFFFHITFLIILLISSFVYFFPAYLSFLDGQAFKLSFFFLWFFYLFRTAVICVPLIQGTSLGYL